MPILTPDQYPLAQPLFQTIGSFHLCALSVLAGTPAGQVWLDDLDQPRVGFIEGSEGAYLAGDPTRQERYEQLREVIPLYAYLVVDPPGWEEVLDQVWSNPAARRHYRQHYVFRRSAAPAWREYLPDGVRAVPVDEGFLKMDYLENFQQVMSWIDGWHSVESFLEHGCGICLLIGETIASWSLMDCAWEDRCEIGIVTASSYRKQGLGRLAVSAMLDACLARGYREIGWQCLASNAGSIAIAQRTGFENERDYLAFSCFLPGENAADMSAEEYTSWALHYEQASQAQIGWAFQAAQARCMAGDIRQALDHLHALCQAGWKARPEWVEGNWRLAPLRDLPEFQALLPDLIEK